jgi:hypothetical protein
MTTFIVITAILIIGCIIYTAIADRNHIRKLEALYQNKQQLEQQLEQVQAANSTPEQRYLTGLEIITLFAQTHQIRLEEVENSDEDFNRFNFSYQGDYFAVWASNKNDSIFIRTDIFASYPSNADNYWPIIRYCYHYTCTQTFVKTKYHIDKNDAGEDEIHLHLCYELMGTSPAGLEYILNSSFSSRREIVQGIADMLKDLQTEQSCDQVAEDQTTVDFQEVAMQMTIDKAKNKEDKQADNSDENSDAKWSY